MQNTHEFIVFSSEGEKKLGVVLEHYANPLDDFYLTYSDYALFKVYSPEEDATVILENVIIPACDEAMADYRLKVQHLNDLRHYYNELEVLLRSIRDN